MLPMKSELKNSFQRLLSDLEDATPNIKDTLLEISPVAFKINLKGHKDIYISIDKAERSISFDPKPNIDFEIVSSLNELFRMLITKKVDRNIIKGDQELAMVLANTLQKADINFLYLLDKYFGNVPALMAHLANEFSFTSKLNNGLDEKNIYSRFRQLAIRMDRLEASKNL